MNAKAYIKFVSPAALLLMAVFVVQAQDAEELA